MRRLSSPLNLSSPPKSDLEEEDNGEVGSEEALAGGVRHGGEDRKHEQQRPERAETEHGQSAPQEPQLTETDESGLVCQLICGPESRAQKIRGGGDKTKQKKGESAHRRG